MPLGFQKLLILLIVSGCRQRQTILNSNHRGKQHHGHLGPMTASLKAWNQEGRNSFVLHTEPISQIINPTQCFDCEWWDFSSQGALQLWIMILFYWALTPEPVLISDFLAFCPFKQLIKLMGRLTLTIPNKAQMYSLSLTWHNNANQHILMLNLSPFNILVFDHISK